MVVTALDETAWLFNLRGGDIAYNPVFMSYALVTADKATLYVRCCSVLLLKYRIHRVVEINGLFVLPFVRLALKDASKFASFAAFFSCT